MDRGETLLNCELPPGSDLADTLVVSKRATDILLKRPEVANVVAFVGTPSSSGGGANQGDVTKSTVYVSLKPRGERKLNQQQFEESVRDALHEIPGARLSFSRSGGLGGKPFRMILAGTDAQALEKNRPRAGE